jgi:peptidyl-prolyl cis-trans isomerase SurA
MSSKTLFLLFFQCSIFGAVQAQKLVNQIVAQVGDNIILWSDIETQRLQLPDKEKAIQGKDCEILEQLLLEELLVNQALIDSLVISDEQVDAEMENRLRIMENKMGGRENLESFYGKSTVAIKEEFRTIIRNKMLAQEMERKITGDITVTPKEVAAFYQKLPKDSIPFINMKLSFQQIVQFPELTAADKKLAYDQLVDIRKQIVSGGKSFETMARLKSMDPGSASQGGKIAASKGMMVPQFESALYDLKPGEVSDIVETMYGYHIIKLVSRKGDDYTVLHILIMPEYSSSSISVASARMDSCYQLLTRNAINWDEAVLRFSNDEATKQNKGVLTNPYTMDIYWDMEQLNEIDQQIYLLTDALESGGVSLPSLYMDLFERKQGIRIVRLQNRVAAHQANLEEDYALIKLAAENDKKQRLLDDWTRTKIPNAYIRLDSQFQACDFRVNWLKTP